MKVQLVTWTFSTIDSSPSLPRLPTLYLNYIDEEENSLYIEYKKLARICKMVLMINHTHVYLMPWPGPQVILVILIFTLPLFIATQSSPGICFKEN